jgi:hypothetical protein
VVISIHSGYSVPGSVLLLNARVFAFAVVLVVSCTVSSAPASRSRIKVTRVVAVHSYLLAGVAELNPLVFAFADSSLLLGVEH